MDDVTSRTRSTGRRMATAKEGGSTKRTSSSRGSRQGQEPDVSPARWAGVALVIAAIVGAIFLAMVSPSQPGQPGEPGEPGQPGAIAEAPSPSPVPTDVEVPVPVVQPVISIPRAGTVTPEVEIAVTVEIPADDTVPRKHLDLHVYNGSQIETVEKPKPGTSVQVQGVRLTPGENSLTAALGSPAGPGPVSEPVVVILDEDRPKLEIVSPKNKHETYDDGVVVEFSSEVGATVRIINEAIKFDQQEVVGPSGEASMLVRLGYGRNRILATSIDNAGQEQEEVVNVTRIDGRPTVKVKHPGSVDPPETARIVVIVTDFKKKPMADAEVYFSASGPNRTAETEISSTNEKGRAVWTLDITDSSSPAEALELGIVVISPSGDEEVVDREISLK